MLLAASTLARPKSRTLTTALVPLAGEHQVARLDVAVDHPVLVGVLQAQRRLVDEVAGVGDRQRPLGLDQLGQVEALDVLHREDDALAEPDGRVGRRRCSGGGAWRAGRISPRKRSSTPRRFMSWLLTTLSTS